jgi:hypothetical protein
MSAWLAPFRYQIDQEHPKSRPSSSSDYEWGVPKNCSAKYANVSRADPHPDAVWVPDGRISAAQSLQQDYRRNDWTSAATRASLLMTLGS